MVHIIIPTIAVIVIIISVSILSFTLGQETTRSELAPIIREHAQIMMERSREAMIERDRARLRAEQLIMEEEGPWEE